MFKGNFAGISNVICPTLRNDGSCKVVNCLFKHPNTVSQCLKRKWDENSESQPNKKFNSGIDVADRKNESGHGHNDTVKKDIAYAIPRAVTHLYVNRAERFQNTRLLVGHFVNENHPTPKKAAVKAEFEILSQSNSNREYSGRMQKFLESDSTEVTQDVELVFPREIEGVMPATLQTRKHFIKIISDMYKRFHPDEHLPNIKAMDDEYRVCTVCTPNTYSQMIRKKIHEISHPEKTTKEVKRLNENDYMAKLDQMLIPKEILTKYGFITDIPQPTSPVEQRICRRCKSPFFLKDQMSKITCRFHPGKVTKKDFGKFYECCGAETEGGSSPCTEADYHVFYWDTPEEMQFAIPFQRTSNIFGSNKDSFKAIGIDCEMGFTTKGFELLRVSAIDFFSGEEVLDVFVRPKGEVIDLNTKWSGILKIDETALTFEDLVCLLGEVMDMNTILIGHGLENDLNAMRIIHEKIIDTAILYPKHKSSPTRKFPLKHLAFKYLGKNIQTGEHDSKEDSLAAIDIVKFFINKDM